MLRAPSLSKFMTMLTAVLTAALVGATLIGVAPAQAALSGGSGTIPCSGGGHATVLANVVTGNTGCAGSVDIPAEITGIGTYAFYDPTTALTSVSGLTGITFASSATPLTIGEFAFEKAGLKSVVIPSRVTSIDKGAFYKNSNLTALKFDGDAPTIGASAFVGVGANATAAIGADAVFSNPTNPAATGEIWKGLIIVRAPDVACSDGGYVDLTGTEVTSVSFCKGEVELPTGITEIGDNKFLNQSELTKITLPATLTKIGVSAFEDATNLVRFIFLGNAPTDVHASSFLRVPYLATAASSATATGFGSNVTGAWWNVLRVVKAPDFTCTKGGWVTVNAPTHTVFDGRVCKGAVVIPDGITSIGNPAGGHGAFEGNTGLIEINLPVSLTTIGANSFMDATGLTTVTFRDSASSLLTAIGSNSFRGATSLTSIFIPKGVTQIASGAFLFDEALASVTFASDSALVGIGVDAFRSTGISSIQIPIGVTNIGTTAFTGSASLADIRFLNATPPTVGANVFVGVNALATASVPDVATGFGVTRSLWNGLVVKIDGQSTVDCSGGGYIIIDTNTPGATSLVQSSNDCAGTVIVPAEVTFIEDVAFENGNPDRGQISSIVFAGNSRLTVIGEAAFAGLTQLASIALPALLQTIGDRAFEGDELLTEITLPASVNSIGDNAFAGIALRGVTFLGDAPEISPLHDPFIDAPVAYARAFVSAGATGFGASGAVWNGLNVLRSPDIACAQNGFVTVSGTVLQDGSECVGSVAIPSAVTEISARAFADSVIPRISFLEDSALTTIGASAFEGALSLDRLSIAANVSFIGVNAFKNTPGLKHFTVDGGNSSFSSSEDQVLFNHSKSKLIAYPAARPVSTGRYTGPSTQASYNVPATVTEIAESAFYNASNIREIIFPGDAPTVGADAFYGVGAGATAKVTLNATGFGDGPTWNGLTIVRAAAPYVAPTGGSGSTVPVVTPPTVVTPKPVAKQIALSQIVAKVLANGVPVLKGRSASKQVEFAASSARLDATDWATLRKVAAGFKGKKGKLILVGFANGKGQSKSAAQKVATVRAENVAVALIGLGVDFEIGYAGYGARNKAKPTTIDNRVDFRWIVTG